MAARRYQFEQRSGGRGAVVRVSEKGAKRLIAVYKDQAAAERVAIMLDRNKDQEV